MHALHTPEQAAQWLRQHASGTLRTDSRQVQAGDAFIAWPGASADGRQFMAQAFAQGASVCLMAHEGHEAHASAWAHDPRVATLPALKQQLGQVAHIYWQAPSHDVALLAITGTNGKTSTACWVAQILAHLPKPQACGVMGTLGVGVWPQLQATGLTTPDPVQVQRSLDAMRQAQVRWCAAEASSIGLAEHRLQGCRIHTAVFTNFSQDHLDYHGSMDAYWAAKKALFDWPGLQAAVIHIDDPKGAQLAHSWPPTGPDLWTCSQRHTQARLSAQPVAHADGLCFDVTERDAHGAVVGAVCRVSTGLLGSYNTDNLLCAMAALRAQGIELPLLAQAAAQVSAVPGRMQRVGPVAGPQAQPLALVDYAHTPDALTQALLALRPLAQARGGQLWCVVGCGGDRDASKRPLMARAVQQHADRVVLTSDNPRSEPPEAILAQMQQGLNQPDGAQVVADRAQAIAQVLRQAAAQDVVLVAGKGHETTQEVAGVFHPFSDAAHVLQALAERAE